VHEAIVVISGRGLGAGLILRALIDNLAIVHVELVHINDLPAGSGGDMQVLDAMQGGQCKGKPFSLLGRDELIHIDRMNWLLTLVIATTVAKGLPASGKTGEKNVGHDSHPWCYSCACLSCMPERWIRHHRKSLCPIIVNGSRLSLIPLWLSISVGRGEYFRVA
jgi:hypothetical protein